MDKNQFYIQDYDLEAIALTPLPEFNKIHDIKKKLKITFKF